jgi:hypothetical protein
MVNHGGPPISERVTTMSCRPRAAVDGRLTSGAKSGVMRDVPNGATVVGSPRPPTLQAKRQWGGHGPAARDGAASA